MWPARFLFLVSALFSKGQTAVVQTQQTVDAAVGEDARLSCQLLQPKEVHQVTWQKVLPEEKKNVATYSKRFGSRVNSDFKDKVEVKDAGLQNCSIVIRDVSEQDGGCYLCLFNSYPDGALTGKTCLQLYELHEPTLHVRESDSSEESVVSCSATGRPAPTVTLTVSQPHLHLSHHNTVRVNNNDSTVTVTTTAVLSGFPDNGSQVGCAARVLSGHKEVWMMIPEVKQTSADGFDEESASGHRGFTGTWIGFVLFSCVAAAVFFTVLLKHHHKNSPSQGPAEKNKTAQKTVTDPDEPQIPLVTPESNPFRLSTAPEQHEETSNPELPSATARRFLFD